MMLQVMTKLCVQVCLVYNIGFCPQKSCETLVFMYPKQNIPGVKKFRPRI